MILFHLFLTFRYRTRRTIAEQQELQGVIASLTLGSCDRITLLVIIATPLHLGIIA